MATGVSDHDLMFSKKAEDSGLQQRGAQWPQPVDSRQAARPPPPSAVRQRMANASGKLFRTSANPQEDLQVVKHTFRHF